MGTRLQKRETALNESLNPRHSMDFLFSYSQTTAEIRNVRSVSNDQKKDHQKLCPLVNNDRQKRGTLTMS